MHKLDTLKSISAQMGMLSLLVLSGASYASNTPSQAPLFTSTTTTPLNMLVMGRDHKLYFEAYNDASDLNGDGVLDVGYKGHLSRENGGIDYFGYFNSNVCYTYTGSGETGYFKPATEAVNKTCPTSNHWSGDYLNYLTTSRMDALRKVLYGGYRATDSTSQTILQGAYIPQDSHAWGKEYNSEAVDGYRISDYTGLSAPSSGRRHLFSVTSRSDGAIPQLQYISGTQNRIWHWISKERGNHGVAGSHCNSGSGEVACTSTALKVRVEVCPTNTALRDDNCKIYPSGAIKPTGVLHDFGETDRMHFGLLTGSYEKNISGGILRANMGSFANEIDPSTGQYCIESSACQNRVQLPTPIATGIVYNINKLRAYGFHYDPVPSGASNNNKYSWTTCPWIADRPMDESTTAKCHMWGNPIGEMMYETLRYYAGGTGPTTNYDYTGNTTVDGTLSLSKPNWQAPYSNSNYSCSVPAMTVISDINPSFDYKLPGSQWDTPSVTTNLSALANFNVSTETNAIGSAEGIHGHNYFIGEANGVADGAPSSKTISNLATVRGLAPEEPTRKGTYYSAGVAKFAAENIIGGGKKLYTYAVALASPLPEIEFKIGTNTITLVPFAKTVSGGFSSYNVDRTKAFRPTNSIADIYVEKIANTDPNGSDRDSTENEGRAYMRFRINFEDQEQGADFDMDAFATYTLKLNSSNQLEVTVNVEQDGGNSWFQNLGYIISGTGPTTDGTYLVVCANNGANCTSTNSYFSLNTPPGKLPGYCKLPAASSNHTDVNFSTPSSTKYVDPACHRLTRTDTRAFTAANNTASSGLLKSPLWYAAKYGTPGRAAADVEGNPDNFFLVTNALNLKNQLTQAFENFKQINNSVTSPAISLAGNEITDGVYIYRTDYQARTWSGDLIKEKLNTTTGKRDAIWQASSALTNAMRTVKISNTAGTDLIDLTWDNLSGRQAHNNSGQLVYVQAELAKTHGSNTAVTVVDGALTQASEIALGQKRLDFIVGKTDLDIRARESIIGDIINSSPVVVSGAQYLTYLAEKLEPSGDYAAFAEAQKNRAKRIYVGANDGMLHGFTDVDTVSGGNVTGSTTSESFAFIPTGVMAELHHLTKPDYNGSGGAHKYYVDATPVVRDVFINGQWKTVLVGTLGAGGRSLFALDVTAPADVRLLWEFNFGDDIAATAPANTPSDMGYSFPAPTIAKLHSGEWAVITGNGYDSPSGRAALMIIDIATGDLIKKLPTATADTHNGLSTVRVADNNSDGVADYVYAGDLKGNLWRFDLIDTGRDNPLTPSSEVTSQAYKVSFGGSPLYSAVSGNNSAQPITAPPSLVRHPSSQGYLVIFGSGSYFRDADKTETSRQTIYGIWDQNTTGQAASNTPTLTRADLQQQTMTTQTVTHVVNGANVSQTARILSNEPIVWRTSEANTGSMGWYLDLGATTADGERLVKEMSARGQVLFAGTMVPANNACQPSLEGWMYGINPFTGGRANFAVFDMNNDGKVDNLDNHSDTPISGFKIPAGGSTLGADRLFTTDGESRAVNFGPTASGRQSWQVIPEDE